MFALNVALALSNWVGYYGFRVYRSSGYARSSLLVMFSMVASTAYHLIEHQKHELPGIGSVISGLGWFNSMSAHELFINLDRAGAVALVLTSMWGLYQEHILMSTMYKHRQEVVLALTFSLISESLHYMRELYLNYLSPQAIQLTFAMTHTIWHILAFHLSNECALLVVNSYKANKLV